MLALSRCQAARVSAAVLVALGFIALSSTSAFAQEATPPAAPAAMPAERPLFEGTHFGVGGSFGADAPSVVLAGNTNNILFGVGLIYNHNAANADADHANWILVGAYMMHNLFPFAMGPEVNFVPQLAPNAFDAYSIRAGWAFWYAPFNIPAVIGTAVYVNFDVTKGAPTVISTVTPAVRVVFGFK